MTLLLPLVLRLLLDRNVNEVNLFYSLQAITFFNKEALKAFMFANFKRIFDNFNQKKGKLTKK
jgi:hypothetical protein